MKFTVIFTTRSRTTTLPAFNQIEQLVRSQAFLVEYEREKQEPQDIGLSILERYRNDIKDQDVTIEDIPNLLEHREDPTIIEIDEELARKSGHFKHRTKFKCWMKQDIMVRFEKIETISSDKNEKMTVIVDEKRLIDEWEKAGFPEEWVTETKQG